MFYPHCERKENLMKKSFRRAISALLCLFTVVSAFAAIPMGAEDITLTEAPKKGQVLWFNDFDGSSSDITGGAAHKWLMDSNNGAPICLSGSATTLTSAPNVGVLASGKMHSSGDGQLFNTYQPDTTPDDDSDNVDNTFFDLVFGRTEGYTDEKEYYLEFDFSPQYADQSTNNVYLGTNNTTAPTATANYGTLTEGEGDAAVTKKVAYTINCLYRGPSYFSLQNYGASYPYLFKLCPAGYLYSTEAAKKSDTENGSYTFKSSDSSTWENFTYTKRYYNEATGKWVDEKKTQPITQEVINEMLKAYPEKYADGISITSWEDSAYDPTKALKIEFKSTYNIHVSIKINDAGTKATYKVYAREDTEADNGAWLYLGSRELDILKGKAVQNTDKNYADNEYPYALRILETTKARAMFDNMIIATYGSCEGDDHSLLVRRSVGNYQLVDATREYGISKCAKCGEEYYTNISDVRPIQSYDFTAMNDVREFTSNTQDYWKNSNSKMYISKGNGLVFDHVNPASAQSGGDLYIHTRMVSKESDYMLSFTTTLNELPVDQTNNKGSSFVTDVTSSFQIFMRIGRNDDYATSGEGWLKIRQNGSTSWATLKSVYTLKKGETYKFDVLLKPSTSTFDLYVNNTYVASGDFTAWDGVTPREYRIYNQMSINAVLKNYSITEYARDNVPFLRYSEGYNFSYNIGKSSGKVYFDRTKGTLIGADASKVPEESSSTRLYDGAEIWINDTDKAFVNTPFNVSIDFMVGEGGKRVAENTPTDKSYMSLITWVTSAGSDFGWGAAVRVGADDTDGDGLLDKYFLVMNKNYSNDKDKSAVYYLTPGEWTRVCVAYNPVDKSAYLYVNGEMTGLAIRDAYQYCSVTPTSSSIRICDLYRQNVFPWAIKDIDIEVTPSKPLELSSSGEIFAMDFGKAVTINSKFVDDKIPSLGGSTTNWGSSNWGTYEENGETKSYPNLTGAKYYKDTEDEEGYVNIKVHPGNVQNGATNMFNVSTSAKLADGSFVNVLDGEKYSIEITYAVSSDHTSLTDAEKRAVEALDNPTKYKTNYIPSNASVTVIRLSKYFDDNACQLIYNAKDGVQVVLPSGLVAAYYADGTRINGYSPFDENGKPENGFITVKAVIDESTNTYSAYVGDSIMYYKSGNKLVPAYNLPMRITVNSKSLAYDNPSWDGFFSIIPHKDANGNTHSGDWCNTSYIRFMQGAYDFSVQSIKVEKLEKEPVYIGSQVKAASGSEPAYDLRLVFGVEDTYVYDIEYDVVATSSDGKAGSVKTVGSNTEVYSSIISGSDVTEAYRYSGAKYFSLLKITDIPIAEKTEYTFEITPYTVIRDYVTGKIERNVLSGGKTYVVKYDGNGNYMSCTEKTAEAKAERTVKYVSDTSWYKALGRTQLEGNSLYADWSAAGIEFSTTCEGNVYLGVSATSASLFTVTIDAENDAYDSVRKNVNLSTVGTVIASNLPYGKYCFKVENQSGYSGVVNINRVTVTGKFDSAPADSDLYIEFIGDSITHGCGLGSTDYTVGTNDGTLTYAYLAAKELGADYTIMANGGMGVLWGSGDDNVSMKKYPYLNDTGRYEKVDDVKVPYVYEGYTRGADIAVIGLSTNDNYRYTLRYNEELKAYKKANSTATEADVNAHMSAWADDMMTQLKAELATLIEEIIKNHGEKVSIVLARGMMEKGENASDAEFYHTSVTYMTKVIEEEWENKYTVDGVDHAVLVARLTPDRTGYDNHPTREGAAKQGAELAKFIKDNMEILVTAE